nr:hypothetical protein [Mycoplasmopsis bovis]
MRLNLKNLWTKNQIASSKWSNLVYLQYKEDLLEINAENFKYLVLWAIRRDKGIYKSSKWRIKWVIKRKKWY